MKDITRLDLIEMELEMAGELTLENLLAYHQAIYLYELFEKHFSRHAHVCTCGYWKEEPKEDMMVN